MFDLKRPCANCPFRKGLGSRFQLAPLRLAEIKTAPAFACHKTVDYDADPLPSKLIERFHSRYQIDQASGCWLWTGALDAYGYGTIGHEPRHAHKTWKAHRLSWEIHCEGELTPEIDVCNGCAHRHCVNPEHLFLGDNALAHQAGAAKGNRPQYRPISIANVEAMRAEYEHGSSENGLAALAERYGCSIAQVHNIVTMRARVHYRKDRPQQCAGLMAVLTREDEPNQIMQVAQRFGALDPAQLDPDRDAYGSWAEVCAAHQGTEP